MSRHERRYLRYLARHQKQGKTATPNTAAEARASAREVAPAVDGPLHECLVPANLFEMGMGNLVFSRLLPDGRIALAVFLLDLFCLGVKNAFITIASRDEYRQRLRRWPEAERLQPMNAACFRKLVEGGVAYAGDLGFSPHADYAVARQIFGDVQSADCATRFEYGHDGKPLYISGPHETPTQVRAILEQLERRVGPGNFDYLVLAE